MHKHRSFTLLILLGVLVVGGMLPRAIHAQNTPSCTDFSLKNNVIVLNIVIPGLKTTECTKSDGVPRTYAYVDGFGTYIVTFYTWFAGAAGTLAVFMAMFAGFQWLTAAGNSGRIGQAKETLTGAIVGLVLLLGSYVLLNTISPTFVNLTGPNVTPVERLGLGCYGGTPAKQCTDVAGGATSSCLPLLNSACEASPSLGQCLCVVSCKIDEVQVDGSLCGFASGDYVSATTPAAVTSVPVLWATVFSTMAREYSNPPVLLDGNYITQLATYRWLRDTVIPTHPAGCYWLKYSKPNWANINCIKPQAVMAQWGPLGPQPVVTPRSDPSAYLLEPNPAVCCQNKTTSAVCSSRSAIGSVEGKTCTIPGGSGVPSGPVP